jgi:ribosomal protein L37AE/L43A
MILNYNHLPLGENERRMSQGGVRVNGRYIDIRGVFYVDTDDKIVRTYNVAGDGQKHKVEEAMRLFGRFVPPGVYQAYEFPASCEMCGGTLIQQGYAGVPNCWRCRSCRTTGTAGAFLWREIKGEIELWTKEMERIA